MANRKMKQIVVTLASVLSISLMGCSKEAENNKEVNSPEQNITNNQESTSTESEDNTKLEKITYQDYDKFKPLEEAKLPYTFENSFDVEHYDDDYEISGSYDLNQDGTEDKITFRCNRGSAKTTVTINDLEIEEVLANPADAYLVDVDTSDSYIDLILYDEGMSADPYYVFYRYDGTQIVSLGGIGAIFESAISFDGHNRVAVNDSFMNALNPAILKGYYEVDKNQWMYTAFDLTEAKSKEYTIGSEYSQAYFLESDEALDSNTSTWAQEESITLHTGDKIIIDDIGENEKYRVKLSDGRVGILYFWIGD